MLGAASGLTYWSDHFGYAHDVSDMPVLGFAAALVAAGLVYLGLPLLVRMTPPDHQCTKRIVGVVLIGGLLARLIVFPSEPVLEDDYQRYLWDGAVTANGINPYLHSPGEAKEAGPDTPIGRLAEAAGPILDRINHPELRSIYPIVAQAAFAAAHRLAPWSFAGWRLICLACDVGVALLLLVLLRDMGRSPLWLALYWWNPLAIKETANSAHLDVVLMVFVLAALAAAFRGRAFLATVALLLAAGIKLWPALLIPVIWRSSSLGVKQRAALIVLAAVFLAVLVIPVLVVEVDETTGFLAYASEWSTNSALFLAISRSIGGALSLVGLSDISANAAARLAVVGALLTVVVMAVVRPMPDRHHLMRSVMMVAAGVFLLSPAQYPWYYLWILPFLPFAPLWGFLVLTATLPLYYTAFFFMAHDMKNIYSHGVVWAVWLPSWLVLAWEFSRRKEEDWPLRISH